MSKLKLIIFISFLYLRYTLVNIFTKKELTTNYRYPYENTIIVHIPVEYSYDIRYTKDVDKNFVDCLKLIGSKTKQEIELLSENNELLERIVQNMKDFSSMDEMAFYYNEEIQEEMIRNSELEEATNKGLKLGEALGEARGEVRGEARGIKINQLETAKNLFSIQPNITLKEASQITGLSLKELSSLKSSI